MSVARSPWSSTSRPATRSSSAGSRRRAIGIRSVAQRRPGLDRRGAGARFGRRASSPTTSSTPAASSIGQLKERLLGLVPRIAAPTPRCRSRSSRSASSSGSRSRPTSSSTSASSTTRTGSRTSSRSPGCMPRCATTSSSQPRARRFLELVQELLELTVPAYRAEGKTRLIVALGCTGGYHRSIALAEELAERLKGREGTTVEHLPPGARAMKRRQLPRWLYPGMHLKRWLLLAFLGITILGLGAAIFLRGPVPALWAGQHVDRLLAHRRRPRTTDPGRGGRRGRAGAHRPRRVGTHAQHRLAVRGARGQRPRGALHQALPGTRAAHRGDRRRDRPLDAAPRAEGVQRQHHRRGRRGRRRRVVRVAARSSSASCRPATSGTASRRWQTRSR